MNHDPHRVEVHRLVELGFFIHHPVQQQGGFITDTFTLTLHKFEQEATETTEQFSLLARSSLLPRNPKTPLVCPIHFNAIALTGSLSKKITPGELLVRVNGGD
jgi:hypothetical protein